MQTNCTYIPYQQTGYFSKLVLDYLDGKEDLKPYYKHPASLDGIKSAIADRQKTTNQRTILVEELRKQYKGIALNELQEANLQKLLSNSTFTITTAHQPNIFTGHLYFIYKIIHAIKLANDLNTQIPECHFVPFFYMGSEDADLNELGHINLNGEKIEWKTNQTGAVGRMLIDKSFLEIIERLHAELSVLPFGSELIEIFKRCYSLGQSVQQATLLLVNELFSHYGLLVLIPDNANLKRLFNAVVKKELTEQFSNPLVEKTAQQLGEQYKIQASGRAINLFYLEDHSRERITSEGGIFKATGHQWSEIEILAEVDQHPEKFSPNVILRGVFQEMILPNVAFIGGGGEIAYWLELKPVFEACDVLFPVLVLRNSFLLINENQQLLAEKLGLTQADLFLSKHDLLNKIVESNSLVQLSLEDEKTRLEVLYSQIRQLTDDVDQSLSDHVTNLRIETLRKLSELEKKMLRAEKKKFEAQQRQLDKLKDQLFPNNSLQERVENFSKYYSHYGRDWIQSLYDTSLNLDPKFAVINIILSSHN